MRIFIPFFFLVCILSSVPNTGAFSASASASMEKALNAGSISGARFQDRSGLKAFYANRRYEPLWLNKDGTWTGGADAFLQILAESWTHGLNPDRYHATRLAEMQKNEPQTGLVEPELLLSDAFVRYARDITGPRAGLGKAEGRSIAPGLIDMAILFSEISDSSDIKKILKKIEPKGKLYRSLQRALVEATLDPKPDFGPLPLSRTLRPGEAHASVPHLRRLMDAPDLVRTGRETVYDDPLAQRVMTFQRQHGLRADGVIGPQTLALLNRTPSDRIAQIVANLERLRWLGFARPDRYVMVNVPASTLWAVENGHVALEMPVIVGRKDRPTNSFHAMITGVRFNPDWTVPPTIKREDFLPMLREDPHYLTKRGIELARKDETGLTTFDPATVDWNAMSEDDLSDIQMMQDSGGSNPLGRVRVIMNNSYNIYLHDTNQPEVFDASARALSSGCIRVSQPVRLADFILGPNEGWNERSAAALIERGKTKDIRAEHPLPVFILYQTVWENGEGDLVFGADLYGWDSALMKKIGTMDGFHPPLKKERPKAQTSAKQTLVRNNINR